jgi:hypothetical protein
MAGGIDKPTHDHAKIIDAGRLTPNAIRRIQREERTIGGP